jgi:hypothetical protein
MQEVPFMTNIIQEEESRIALLGLIATESEKVDACPSDETLATFLEGKLTGKARQATGQARNIVLRNIKI